MAGSRNVVATRQAALNSESILPLLSTLSYSALSGIGGWYFGNQLTARQNRRENETLQDEILAEIDERYDSYVELEARITHAIQQFDQQEAHAAREIALREQRIDELEGCLERTIEHAHAEGGALTQLERALGSFLEDVGGERIETSHGRRDLELEMRELRGGLARSQNAHSTQVVEQEALIGQLTESVARFEAELESTSSALALEASVAIAVVEEPEGLGDDRHAELEASAAVIANQRDELTALQQRVEALCPYVDRLATAQQRIEQLEDTCADLRGGHEQACAALRTEHEQDVSGLRSQVAELEASGRARAQVAQDTESDTQDAERVRVQLERRVAELAPVAEQLGRARERVLALEEQCTQVDGRRAIEVGELESRVEELETSNLGQAQALRSAADEGERVRTELEQRVAKLSPLAQELEQVHARVQELEGQCADVDRARGDEQRSSKGSERTLARTHAELAQVRADLESNRLELSESELRERELEARCDSIGRRKEEQLDVLRTRVMDMEQVYDELARKGTQLEEMEERCESLERSNKRAASAGRRLRLELAEAAKDVLESGADPQVLRHERNERREQLLSLFDELEELVAGMQSQEKRVDELHGAYDDMLCDQDRDLVLLEDRVRELYASVEGIGDVIAQLESKP